MWFRSWIVRAFSCGLLAVSGREFAFVGNKREEMIEFLIEKLDSAVRRRVPRGSLRKIFEKARRMNTPAVGHRGGAPGTRYFHPPRTNINSSIILAGD